MYSSRISFSAKTLDEKTATRDPGIWISDCQACAGYLWKITRGIATAKKKHDLEAVAQYRADAQRVLTNPQYLNGYKNEHHSYLANKKRYETMRSDKSTPPFKLLLAQRTYEEYRRRMVTRESEMLGLHQIAIGQDIPLNHDWYKYPGAAFLVHLGDVQLEDPETVECCDVKRLRNRITKTGQNSYESDVVICNWILDPETNRQKPVISETLVDAAMVTDHLEVRIAKLMFDRFGNFEDKILMRGNFYHL